MDLKDSGQEDMDWISLHQQRDKCQAPVNTVMNCWDPKKCKDLPVQPLLHRMSQFKNHTKIFSLTSSNAALSLAWRSSTSLYISHNLFLLQKENNLNIKLNYLHAKMWIHIPLYSMVQCFHTPHSIPPKFMADSLQKPTLLFLLHYQVMVQVHQ